jgi:Lon protease-like protein
MDGDVGRYRIALFPLPVVLLPGARMPLHIFEQRYRDMVRDALDGNRRFGMVYHDWDEQGPFLSEEGTVGCIGEITAHEAMDGGRSLIVLDGIERFSIDDGLESETLYFEGLVRAYNDLDGGPSFAEDIPGRRQATIDLFEAVLSTFEERPELPDFSVDGELAFLLAQTIQVDPRWHQDLLVMRDEVERLDRLDEVFQALLD